MNRIKGLVKQTNKGGKMVEQGFKEHHKERWDKLARNTTALSQGPKPREQLSARRET